MMKKLATFLAIFLLAFFMIQLVGLFMTKSSYSNFQKFLEQNPNVNLLSFEDSHGLFYSSLLTRFEVLGIGLELNASSKHLLFSNQSTGWIDFESAGLKNIAKITFGEQKPFIIKHKAGFKEDFFELQTPEGYFAFEGEKYIIQPFSLKANLSKDKKVKLSIDLPKFSYEDKLKELSISSFKQDLSFKGEPKSLIFANESSIKAKNITFSSFLSSLKINDISIDSRLSEQDGLLDASVDLFFKDIEFMYFKANDISLDFNATSIDKSGFEEFLKSEDLSSFDFSKIITKDFKLSINDFSFGFDGGKIESKLNLSTKQNTDFKADFLNNLEFSAELQASKPLSSLFGLFGKKLREYEELGLYYDILLKDNEGYKLSLKSLENDIIFNDKVLLSQVLDKLLIENLLAN